MTTADTAASARQVESRADGTRVSTCTVEGCDGSCLAKGLCSKHYERELCSTTHSRRQSDAGERIGCGETC
jgi:hypothetical protein